jgi:hypothetical protein
MFTAVTKRIGYFRRNPFSCLEGHKAQTQVNNIITSKTASPV